MMKRDIGVNTKLAAIIGTDIGHSKSPAMMNAAYEKLGLDAYYYPMNVKEEDFGDVICGISKMNFMGLTITIPYKIEVMKYLDEIDRTAEIIGAVNTIKITDGKMKGFNTDGEGFVRGLENDKGTDIADSTFLVIGAGGVSRAIMTVLATRKTGSPDKKIYLANRTFERAEELCEKLNSLVCDCCVPVRLDGELGKYAEKADVLVNATNVGMPPYGDMMPVDAAILHKDMLVADVIYNPAKTKLLEAAEACGCDTVNGQSLLLHQGKLAFNIWTGLEAPGEEMFNAVFGEE
jgi:shikimate dehydrogenase